MKFWQTMGWQMVLSQIGTDMIETKRGDRFKLRSSPDGGMVLDVFHQGMQLELSFVLDKEQSRQLSLAVEEARERPRPSWPAVQ